MYEIIHLDYPVIICQNITDKTGKLVSIQAVTDANDLMIINRSGTTIRTAVDGIRMAGRATQGVRIINLREGDSIASVMAVPKSDDAEDVIEATATEQPTDQVVAESSATENVSETPQNE